MDRMDIKLILAAVLTAAVVGGCGGGGGGTPAAEPDTGNSITALVAFMNSMIASTDDTSEPIDITARTMAVDDTTEPVKL